jgi:hypothetical protein
MKQPLIKSFCGGSRGAVFTKSAPLAAGGKKKKEYKNISTVVEA